MNEEDCLLLYEEKIKITTPTVSVDLVCKALIDDANQTYVDKNLRSTAVKAYRKSNDTFIAFSKLLFEKHTVYVSKHHFMGVLKVRAPMFFAFLRTLGMQATKEYDLWAESRKEQQ